MNCEASWYRGETPGLPTLVSTPTGRYRYSLGTGDASYTVVSDYRLQPIHAVEPGRPLKNERYEAEDSLQTGVTLRL